MISFSVIIPTYNRKKELQELLVCLILQTYKNFEVLICDDGSTDNTDFVVSKYKVQLDINYIKLNNSGGPALPRNVGIENSKYDWLCFIDSDDLWTNNKLEVLSATIQKSNEEIFCHPVQVFGENYSKKEIIGRYKRGLLLSDFKSLIYNGNKIVNSSLCINKKVIKNDTFYNTNPDYHGIEDYIFLLNLTRLGYKIKSINYILGFYRIHDNNISSDSQKQLHKLKTFFNSCNFPNISLKMISAQLKYIEIRINHYNRLTKIKLYLEIISSPSSIEIKFKSFLKIFHK